MNKLIEPAVYVAVVAALSYYAYRMIKDGLRPPPVESRDLVVGYEEDGSPITDPDCDIERTLELWREQNRLIRNS
jgi:hypothetical protein